MTSPSVLFVVTCRVAEICLTRVEPTREHRPPESEHQTSEGQISAVLEPFFTIFTELFSAASEFLRSCARFFGAAGKPRRPEISERRCEKVLEAKILLCTLYWLLLQAYLLRALAIKMTIRNSPAIIIIP